MMKKMDDWMVNSGGLARLTLLLVLVVMVVALSTVLSSVVSAETITYVYTESSSDSLWASGSKSNPDSVEVELPNTTMDLELIDSAGDFRITLTDMNVTELPVLNITGREVNLSDQNFSASEMGTSSSSTYQAKYGYAFDIDQYSGRDYRVSFNFTALGVSSPRIYKCDYNFSENLTDFNCTRLSTSSSGDLVFATADDFSSFFLTEYHAPSNGGGSSGGGGGGSSGDSGGNIIHVTPTLEGESVQVWNGDTLIVHLGVDEYQFRVTKAKSQEVVIKDLATYYEHVISLGDEKRIGVTSFFAEDFYVSMHVVDGFALLSFRLPQKRASLFNLLPPASRTVESSQEVTGEQTAPVTVQQPSAPASAAEEPESLDDVQMPESPIDLWTVLVGIVFVVLIVGGFALYRFKLRDLSQPPTVTGSGEAASAVSSSSEAAPARLLSGAQSDISAGGAVSAVGASSFGSSEGSVVSSADDLDKPLVITKPVEKPYIELDAEHKLELEKFVYHAFSEGFTADQIRVALLKKGWPEGNVDEVLDSASR